MLISGVDFLPPTYADVRAACERLAGVANRTPVLRSRTLDERTGARLFFKCENFQRVGAFKFRGAYNAVSRLPDSVAERGVVTHSSGNHAAALALAARLRGIPATIVVPRNASRAKIASVERYGGRIEYCAPTIEAREALAGQLANESGATLVHPYNNPWVIAGQGTAALEFLEEVPDLDIILAPVSGGGLLSGTALAAHGVNPGIRIVGVEPSGADDAIRSLAAGRIVTIPDPRTICDGLRAPLGSLTFPIIREHVSKIVSATDDETLDAMRLAWEVLKILVEPSAAVVLAAILAKRTEFAGMQVGVILSGGNVDLDSLPWTPEGPL